MAKKRKLKKGIKRSLIIIPLLIIFLFLFYNFIHIYKPATCTSPETCYICHKIKGEALGHDYTDVSCTSDSYCLRCLDIKEKALGHDYIKVTDSLDICLRCHDEKGTLKEYSNEGTYLVYCDSVDKILYCHNEETELACASITKLVTASIVLKYLDLDDVICVGEEIYELHPNSSKAWLAYDDELTVRQLLEAMLIPSGNDAAFVLARNVVRKIDPNLNVEKSITCFVKMMNEYCENIGCIHSVFYSPDGYDYELQHTSCTDLIKIAKNILKYEEIKNIVSMTDVYEISRRDYYYNWTNTNKLLNINSIYYDENVTGLKTGTTPLANNCIVITYNNDDVEYIIVILNEESDASRYELAQELIGLIK